MLEPIMRAHFLCVSFLLGFTSTLASTEEKSVKRVDLSSITAWSFTAESPLTSSPAIFKRRIYIGDSGGTVYALNAGDGSLLWKVNLAASVKTRLLATDRDVVVANGNLLSALDKKGKLQWRRELEGADGLAVIDPWDIYRSSPYQNKNTVYVGSDDGAVYGFNRKSGKPIYRCKTPKSVPIRNQPLVDVLKGRDNVALNRAGSCAHQYCTSS